MKPPFPTARPPPSALFPPRPPPRNRHHRNRHHRNRNILAIRRIPPNSLWRA